MKKFIIFALCAISAGSVFAEPFSNAKFLQIQKTKNWVELKKYAYEAQISEETNLSHLNNYSNYIKDHLKKANLNITEFEEIAKKFKGKINGANRYEYGMATVAAQSCLEDKMLQFSNKLENKLVASVYNHYIRRSKNKVKIWQYGKKVLLIDGGCENYSAATDTINKMFRYKPSNITKEEQIEFLSKLSQIYPIPGTDFNKWKNFMGFVGFKYKQLTGKELF